MMLYQLLSVTFHDFTAVAADVVAVVAVTELTVVLVGDDAMSNVDLCNANYSDVDVEDFACSG